MVILLFAVVVLVGLMIMIARNGPDRTTIGTITEQAPHRLCVDGGTGVAVCTGVDSPERLVGFAVGDCVRLRSSAEGILIAIDRRPGACGRP